MADASAVAAARRRANLIARASGHHAIAAIICVAYTEAAQDAAQAQGVTLLLMREPRTMA